MNGPRFATRAGLLQVPRARYLLRPWWPAITIATVESAQIAGARTLTLAKNRGDLVVVLDDFTGRPEVAAATAALARLGASPLLRLAPKDLGMRESAWAPLGPVAAKLVALGYTYAVHGQRVVAAMDLPAEALEVTERWAERTLEVVRAPETPVELASALLAIRRVPAALLGLLRELEHPSTFPAWMVLELAELFMAGERALLGLIATEPGVAIPENVLPHEHRLDIGSAAARNAVQLVAWDALPVEEALPEDDEASAA